MIEVNNLHHSFFKNNVLNDINLKVNNKEFVAVVGPNGSGKSTLLKCIYRILNPDRGIIKLQNKEMDKIKLQDSAKLMSVVAQHNFLNFDFIVEDMVLMGRHPYKKNLERNNINDYEIVEKALKSVDMLDFKKREFTSLSGGEQQRVVLARALAQEPKCLILDEPTNHLDIKHQLHLLKIIKDLNISVLAAVHDLNIAINYSDYIYIMKDGKVVSHGKPFEVVTKELIKEVFEVDSEIHKYDDDVHIVFKVQ